MSVAGNGMPKFFDVEKYFDTLDTNHDGFVDEEELTNALSSAGVPVTPALVKQIITQVDTSKDGKISLDELKEFATGQDVKLRKVFDQLDISKTGTLTRDDISQTLHVIDPEASEDMVDHILNAMDKNHDGTISYEEFLMFAYLIPAERLRAQFSNWAKTSSFDIGDSVTIPDDKKPGAWATLASGAVAGAVSRTSTAPLDRLKVLMQAQTSNNKTGIMKGFQDIYHEGGVKSFFRGNGTNVIKIAPETACKFIMFDKIKEVVCKNAKKPTTLERLMAGGLAGFFSQSLIYPLEICKTRLAMAPAGTYSGIAGCIKTIIAKEGPFALYKGWGASVVGIIPYASIDMAVFNTLKERYTNKYAHDPSVTTLLACGAFSGICGQLVSYPLALVRTLLQLQGLPGRKHEFNGMLDCAVKTIKADGPFGLYRGILPNFMKSVPAIAISYAVFEKMKRLMV